MVEHLKGGSASKTVPPIIEIGHVLVSSDIITEHFSCDIGACKGQCCVEGDAGAPVTIEEIAAIEDSLDTVWGLLQASAQAVISRQGVAYCDRDGDLVTSIVGGRDCVFTYYENSNCMCALEKAFLQGKTTFRKPISCSLYPIREKPLGNGTMALNYNRWAVCSSAVSKGRREGVPLYTFLRDALIRRFGSEWYEELCTTVNELRHQGYLDNIG